MVRNGERSHPSTRFSFFIMESTSYSRTDILPLRTVDFTIFYEKVPNLTDNEPDMLELSKVVWNKDLFSDYENRVIGKFVAYNEQCFYVAMHSNHVCIYPEDHRDDMAFDKHRDKTKLDDAF